MTRVIVTALVQLAGIAAVLASVTVLFGGWWAVLLGGCSAIYASVFAEARTLTE